ncbi:MAG: hypothetical protein AcusKO_04750 [Acuticoccus sp.]
MAAMARFTCACAGRGAGAEGLGRPGRLAGSGAGRRGGAPPRRLFRRVAGVSGTLGTREAAGAGVGFEQVAGGAVFQRIELQGKEPFHAGDEVVPVDRAGGVGGKRHERVAQAPGGVATGDPAAGTGARHGTGFRPLRREPGG